MGGEGEESRKRRVTDKLQRGANFFCGKLWLLFQAFQIGLFDLFCDWRLALEDGPPLNPAPAPQSVTHFSYAKTVRAIKPVKAFWIIRQQFP